MSIYDPALDSGPDSRRYFPFDYQNGKYSWDDSSFGNRTLAGVDASQQSEGGGMQSNFQGVLPAGNLGNTAAGAYFFRSIGFPNAAANPAGGFDLGIGSGSTSGVTYTPGTPMVPDAGAPAPAAQSKSTVTAIVIGGILLLLKVL